MQYFTVETLGPQRSLTPEGFLLCRDTPIARTGVQLYGPGETPISMDAAGIVRIEREPEDVFHPACIASLHGKPVVNEHPTDELGERADVTPKNWRQLAVGHVINPRRGEGIDDDVLLADLLITDQDAIDLIDAGKRELSVGYDAEYDELAPGLGRQRNIRANHVALVERGRCGPRCAIGDADLVGFTQCQVEQPTHTEGGAMAVKRTWADKIRAAFRARDEEAMEKALDNAEEGEGEPNGGGVHVHLHQPGEANGNGGDQEGGVALDPEQLKTAVATIHALEEQMITQGAEMDEAWDAIDRARSGDAVRDAYPHRDARRAKDGRRPRDQEKEDKEDSDTEDARNRDDFPEAPGSSGNRAILSGFQMEAPPGTRVADLRKARDSALFEDSFSETVALAEIIMPGIRLPTFDRAAPPKKTVDALCAFRARVLDLAFQQPETRELIDNATGGRFDSAGKMGCDNVRLLFRAVADTKSRANKATLRVGATDLVFGGGVQTNTGLSSPADLQAVLDKHYQRSVS